MPDIKDAKRQVHDAMTEAGAMPQWEPVTWRSDTNEPDTWRLLIPGGWLYNHSAAIVFVPYMACDEAVQAAEENADEWFARAVAAEAERDAAREQLHRLEEENGRLRGEVELLQGARDRAQHGYEREHDIRLDWEAEALKYHQQARNLEAALSHAREELTASRVAADDARAELAEVRVELDQARQAADDWAAKAREYAWVVTCAARLLGMKDPDNADPGAVIALLRAWSSRTPPLAVAEIAGPPCPNSKAKQFGPATFVVRSCKLVDGHDGQCEPA